MTSALETTTPLSPVAVDCGWCGTQFLSRARHMQSVHCPRCGHSARVKRQAGYVTSAEPPAALAQPTTDDAAAPTAGGVAGRTGAHHGPVDDDADEDDATYTYDRAGRLVLAEWTADGRLVPAQLTAAQLATELSARGYRVNRSALPGGCQVTETLPAVQDCGLAASAAVAGIRVCAPHEHALTAGLRRQSN